MRMIIGLSGVSGSGKDAVASILGYKRIAFADKLKDIVKELRGYRHDQLYGALKDVVDPRYGRTPAEDLQAVGTGLREILGEDVWVKAALSAADTFENVVVTDVRFPNEAEFVRFMGGHIVRIERPGHVSQRAAHISEVALNGYAFDYTLVNAGNLNDLKDSVRDMLKVLSARPAR
jgi:hypothetical protein